MDLQDRQKTILEALVRQYVKTAVPVSSKDLQETFKLPFSSATIRNDFTILDKKGYLSKPHISAGRIPTDKAYRFYINDHEEAPFLRGDRLKPLSALAKESKTEEAFLRDSAAILSAMTKSFTAVGIAGGGAFFKYGFSEILHEPEFSDQSLAQNFSEFIDGFELHIHSILKDMPEHTPEAFIGKENPLKGAREYGMVIYAYTPETEGQKKKNGKHTVTLMGPKRMDYERHISILKEFDEVVREFYGA